MSKRLFDLVLVGLTAPVWLPVLLVTMLLMLLIEGRPIFYRSNRRVGMDRTLPIMKFRTMVRNAEAVYNRQTVPVTNQRFLNTPIDSPLYTKLGRLIEKCQFTELPQVFHVVAGHMSIIGNRPLPENVVASLREAFPRAEDRFLSPSGLTGLVQLIGRQEISDGDRLALESHYCRAARENYSARLDFLILLYTILISLRLMPHFSLRNAHGLIDRYSPSPTQGMAMADSGAARVEQESP